MVVGEHDLSTSAETSRTRQYEVDRIVVHTNQRGDPSKVDLALIRVRGSIDLTVHTPLCLPEPDLDVTSGNVTLAGEDG